MHAAATHCNTLQHTATHSIHAATSECMHLMHAAATHCNTLQHTATHCNTLHICISYTCRTNVYTCHIHTHTLCNTLQHTPCKVLCNTLQHITTHHNTLQHTAIHCNTLQHTAPYTATYCNKCRVVIVKGLMTLQEPQLETFTATHCNTIPLPETHCNTMQYTLQHNAAHTLCSSEKV